MEAEKRKNNLQANLTMKKKKGSNLLSEGPFELLYQLHGRGHFLLLTLAALVPVASVDGVVKPLELRRKRGEL